MGKPVLAIGTGGVSYRLDISIDGNAQGPWIYSPTKKAKMRGHLLKGIGSYY